jgi:hypothetical protein
MRSMVEGACERRQKAQTCSRLLSPPARVARRLPRFAGEESLCPAGSQHAHDGVDDAHEGIGLFRCYRAFLGGFGDRLAQLPQLGPVLDQR